MEKKQEEFNLGELTIMLGLMMGHRLRMAHNTDEKHWAVLEGLHKKLVLNIATYIDEHGTGELKNG